MLCRFYYIFIALLFCIAAYSQHYSYNIQHYGVEEGLSHRDARALFQDSEGFLWIATADGLNRFDGYGFQWWSNAQLGVYDKAIESIGQDADGWLWIKSLSDKPAGTWRLSFFHPVTEAVKSLEEKFPDGIPIGLNSSEPGYWATHSRRDLQVKDHNNRLLFGSVNTPVRYITYHSEEGFKVFHLPQLEQLIVHCVDKNGNIWGSEWGNLIQIDPGGNMIARYTNTAANSVRWIQEINNTIYYEGYHYDHSKQKDVPRYVYKLLADNSVTKVVFSVPEEEKHTYYFNPRYNYMYIIGDKTLRIADITTTNILQCMPFPESKTWEHNLPVQKNGLLWVNNEYGVMRIELQTQKFRNYCAFTKTQVPAFSNSARGITMTGNDIWANFEIGTLVHIDKTTGQWEQLQKEYIQKTWGRPILKDNNNILWTGDYNFLFAFHPNTHDSIIALPDSITDKNHVFWALYQDKNDTMWIGTGRYGLAYICPLHSEIRFVRNTGTTALDHATIYHIAKDNDGYLWLCTDNGLFQFDPASKKVIGRAARTGKTDYTLPADVFFHFYPETDTVFWLASATGLVQWNRYTLQTKHYTRKDGLPNDNIYAIYADQHAHLWMSTDYGIAQFNTKTEVFRNYLPRDGIAHSEFNRISHYQDTDGTIYFGGLNGITAFHPDDFRIEDITQNPQLVITGFEQFDGKANALIDRCADIRTTHSVSMQPEDGFFQMELALLVFEHQDLVQYAYAIEDTEDAWHILPANTLRLGRLPYGNHLLKLKARNPSGQWSENELAITIHMLKPFYLKNDFILSVLLALAAAVLAYTRLRTRQLRRRQAVLQKEIQIATAQIRNDKRTIETQAENLSRLNKVQSRLFTNISHELRTPLTLIMGPVHRVLQRKKQNATDATLLSDAYINAKKLLQLITSILNVSRMDAGKMTLHPQATAIFPFFENLVSAFMPHAQYTGVHLHFQYLADKTLFLELDNKKLEIVINNLLSNATKFTPPDGRITLYVKEKENHLHISITDTGYGIHPEDLPHVFDRFYQSNQPNAPTKNGSGIGLALAKEYVNLMNGSIRVESTLHKGTTFFVNLPKNVADRANVNIDTTDTDDNIALPPFHIPVVVASEQRTSVSTQQPLILIVEDNASLRRYIQQFLTPAYTTVHAQNGQIAWNYLTVAKQNKNTTSDTALPALILCDIMMPVMDGYQLLQLLKKDDTLRNIPIIMLTARADIQDKLKALRIGVDDYILKPFEEEEVLIRIQYLLNNAIIRTQYAANEEEQKNKTLLPETEKEWLEKLDQCIRQHIADPQFNVTFLAKEMQISNRQLQRRIKQHIGISPKEYISDIRLYHARHLLETRQVLSVKEAAQKSGFLQTKYFSHVFKKRFGKTPNSYL